jgi:CRISPR-associated protein Cas5t
MKEGVMRVVKLKLYQNLCNYRREGSFGYVQTYPLPTPSMIKGMAHSLLGLNEYKPLKISIKGESDGVVTNIQKVYKFGRDPKNRPQNPYIVMIGNSEKTATHGMMFVDLHINVRLIIHIHFDEENLNEELVNKIKEATVVLGRNEDIARIDEAKLVEVKEPTERRVKTRYPMYVIPDSLIEKTGTAFRLPFYYQNVESFDENRVFKFVDVNYIGKDVPLKKDLVNVDSDNDIICWLGLN